MNNKLEPPLKAYNGHTYYWENEQFFITKPKNESGWYVWKKNGVCGVLCGIYTNFTLDELIQWYGEN